MKDFEYPKFESTSESLLKSMTKDQRNKFNKYTNGRNQIASVKMNSHGSFKHFQDFADKIGANSLASDLGWHKVWSPLYMIVNPSTGEIAANDWFGGYQLCNYAEEINVGLQQVGIAERDDKTMKHCAGPRN